MSNPNQKQPGGSFELGGHRVARVGYGALQLASPSGEAVNRDTGIALLLRAVELGVNHIDTAEFYGPHIANDLIRSALRPYTDDLVLATKVGAEPAEQGGVIAVPAGATAFLELSREVSARRVPNVSVPQSSAGLDSRTG